MIKQGREGQKLPNKKAGKGTQIWSGDRDRPGAGGELKWEEELRNDGLRGKDCREKTRRTKARRQRECRLCGEQHEEVMGLEQDKWWKESSLRGTSRKSVFISVSPLLPQINTPVPHPPLLSAKSMSTVCVLFLLEQDQQDNTTYQLFHPFN